MRPESPVVFLIFFTQITHSYHPMGDDGSLNFLYLWFKQKDVCNEQHEEF